MGRSSSSHGPQHSPRTHPVNRDSDSRNFTPQAAMRVNIDVVEPLAAVRLIKMIIHHHEAVKHAADVFQFWSTKSLDVLTFIDGKILKAS